jgi:citrate synthase
MLHTNIQNLIETFRYDAHPMSVFISSVASLATLYPDSRDVTDPENRALQVARLIAKVPTIAACAYRHNQGWPFNRPDDSLSYVGNFLNMMFKMTEVKYEPNPVLERAINVLFVLHADHEQNCGTTAMRVIGSARRPIPTPPSPARRPPSTAPCTAPPTRRSSPSSSSSGGPIRCPPSSSG